MGSMRDVVLMALSPIPMGSMRGVVLMAWC